MTAPSDIYLAAVARVAKRAETWSDRDAATPIPACPRWSARDLVAHLAGGAADHAAGRLDGFPGPRWTDRHIVERSSLPTRDVVTELLTLSPRTAAACDQRPAGPNSSWDAYIHERDLAEAFDGEVPNLDDHGRRLLGDILAFLDVDVPFGMSWSLTDDSITLVVVDQGRHETTVDAAAAFRAVAGRGTSDETANWPWSPTPPPRPALQQLQLF